jgi:hypothetical protein
VFKQHQAIRPYTKTPVAQKFDLLWGQRIIAVVAVINDHKVIAGAVVFVKSDVHIFKMVVNGWWLVDEWLVASGGGEWSIICQELLGF